MFKNINLLLKSNARGRGIQELLPTKGCGTF